MDATKPAVSESIPRQITNPETRPDGQGHSPRGRTAGWTDPLSGVVAQDHLQALSVIKKTKPSRPWKAIVRPSALR